MKIALVSEGPSACDYPGPDGYDEIIGANGVPSLWPCTWWVFMDSDMYLHWMNRIIGRPNIFTSNQSERDLKGHRWKAKGLEERLSEDLEAGRIVFEEQVPPVPPMPQIVPLRGAGNMKGTARWSQYTGLACLACAWYLANEAGVQATVDVYGVDLKGTDDCHDRPTAPARTPDRWIFERQLFTALCQGFRDSGDLIINWPQEKP